MTTGGASFSPELFQFLKELGRNNNREWFTANKRRYEETVLGPSVRFAAEMGPKLARFSPHLTVDARPFGGSISRIYRDTRFSKDKSPYKTNVGIHFAHDRSSDSEQHLPGLYFHIEPGGSMVASGIWRPEPPALKRIRDAIVSDSSGWSRVTRSCPPSGGESYARVPAGFPAGHKFAADLKRKDFFASVEFKDAEVSGLRFDRTFLTACGRIDPLNRFLAEAVGVPW